MRVNVDAADAAASIPESISAWLDAAQTKDDRPVVFVAFGSISAGLSEERLRLADVFAHLGRHRFRFLWAVRQSDRQALPRHLRQSLTDSDVVVSDDGALCIAGWVPQVAVLRHPKVRRLLAEHTVLYIDVCVGERVLGWEE